MTLTFWILSSMLEVITVWLLWRVRSSPSGSGQLSFYLSSHPSLCWYAFVTKIFKVSKYHTFEERINNVSNALK